MKRYTPEINCQHGHVMESETGELVFYSEAQSALAEKDAQIAALEKLRPHWAQGHSDDGVAAQCATNALQTLWDLLRAKNQTEAVSELHKLVRMAYEKRS